MLKKYTNVGVFAVAFLGLASLSWFPPPTRGQDPAPSSTAPTANTTSPAATQPAPTVGSVPDYIRPQAHQPQRRRSIVHHYPYPYPGAYYADETAGFRNPGGVGRYAEYYPPGDRFQVEGDPVRVAQFGVGGYPSQADQRAAQSLGIQRYNSIQQHIDNYAMPRYGYGFGMGGFGGFW
jgi:hypothetical protein